MDPTSVVRRVINKPRDVITRNPAMNPDVKTNKRNFSSKILNLIFFLCLLRHY
jgi:hypothetical protein